MKRKPIKFEATDRYGGPQNWPDPATMCKGQCEGTGWVPPEKPNGPFTKCPDCNGTGKRKHPHHPSRPGS
jgi:hypothetical protein